MSEHDVRMMLRELEPAPVPRPDFEDELLELLTTELQTTEAAPDTAAATPSLAPRKRAAVAGRIGRLIPAPLRERKWALAAVAGLTALVLLATAVICDAEAGAAGCVPGKDRFGSPKEELAVPEAPPGPFGTGGYPADAPFEPPGLAGEPGSPTDGSSAPASDGAGTPAESPGRGGSGGSGSGGSSAGGTAGPGAPVDQIAFARQTGESWDIFTMRADGTRRRQITSGPLDDRHPTWSPDGTKIAFGRFDDVDTWYLGGGRIFVVNADGSGLRYLADGEYPYWSPDGRKIAYSASDPHSQIFTMNPDGSDRRRIELVGVAADPAWSPRGDRIAFAGGGIAETGGMLEGVHQATNVYSMRPDGSDAERLTDYPWACNMSFSPDGRTIAYTAATDGVTTHVWTMKADGSAQRRLTGGTGFHAFPHWSPDGRRIVFAMDPDGDPSWVLVPGSEGPMPGAIWEMKADGTGLRRISPPGVDDADPVYRPRKDATS